jgi:hypothetical protein
LCSFIQFNCLVTWLLITWFINYLYFNLFFYIDLWLRNLHFFFRIDHCKICIQIEYICFTLLKSGSKTFSKSKYRYLFLHPVTYEVNCIYKISVPCNQCNCLYSWLNCPSHHSNCNCYINFCLDLITLLTNCFAIFTFYVADGFIFVFS